MGAFASEPGCEASPSTACGVLAESHPSRDLRYGFWNLCFPGAHHDEVGIEGYQCSEPWDCHCLAAEREGGPRNRCGSTVRECQANIVAYYRDRAAHLENLTSEQFLESMGYYGVEPDDNGGRA